MRSRALISSVLSVGVLVGGVLVATAARRGDVVDRVDYSVTKTPTSPA